MTARPLGDTGAEGPSGSRRAIGGPGHCMRHVPKRQPQAEGADSDASSGPYVSGAVPVLLIGVPRDLEQMTIGIGEVPGVHAERAHMSGRGQRASGGLDLPEQLVDLCL
jgi:hypothetical protein